MMGRIFKRRCGACGSELLRTDSGPICPDSHCAASPIASPGPPPELVRDAQLRAAGYVPASPIRPAMPTLKRPLPPEVPEPPPPKSPAERRADDMRWARGHLELLNRGKSASGVPRGGGVRAAWRGDTIERRGGGR